LAVTISTAAALTGTNPRHHRNITATKAIAMTALQKTIVTSALAVFAGVGITKARQASQPARPSSNPPATANRNKIMRYKAKSVSHQIACLHWLTKSRG